MLIAGDIGGTKTLLALYAPESGVRRPVAQAEYHSSDHAGLAPMVRQFLARAGRSADQACFDVAGPVIEGRARLTNLPWVLDEEALCSDLGLQRVTLLNDLQAVATAVPHLRPADLHTLNRGHAEPQGAIAVIAPGTGLGEAFLVWSGTRYVACSSEGGHADFAPADESQAQLLGFLRARFGHVSCERVCSGSGLTNIYEFLRDTGVAEEPSAFATRLSAASDRAPLIVAAATRQPRADPLAAATLRVFVTILGAEAGNLALKVLAGGGVYVAGGIAPRILPQLEGGAFMHAFTDKGRFADRLAAMPVHVITAQAALMGAAIRGLDIMRSAQGTFGETGA